MSQTPKKRNPRTQQFKMHFEDALSASYGAGDITCMIGGLSFFIGIVGIIVGVLGIGSNVSSTYEYGNRSNGAGAFTVGLTAILAAAPTIGFGKMINDSKKQTSLLALQTWESQRNIDPDIEEFKADSF